VKAKIRELFIAPKDKLLLAVDFSQGETWITAHLANEQMMIEFLTNSDVHTETANFLFHPAHLCHEWVKKGKGAICTTCGQEIIETERFIGKKNNHANSYGQGAERQAQGINKESDKPPYVTVSIKQCRGYQEAWHNLYPNIHNIWHMEVQRELISKRTLITPYGFRRRFYEHMNDQLFKAAYAFIPQSTLLDHCSGKLQPGNEIPGGLREVKKIFVDRFPNDFKIINMSHDSFCMECPTSQVKEVGESCIKIMQRPMIVNGMEFTIPVDAEVGENYGNMESL